jgi:hypothetical protein
MPSLHPKTILQPLTIANWQPEWDDDDDNADSMEESKEDAMDIGGTAEAPQQQDDALAVDINAVAAQATIAHAANDSMSIESGSPPLLSNPPFPGPPTVNAPTPPFCILLDDSSTAICYAAEAPWMPTPSIGALPTGNNDPIAKLNHTITVHLAELNQQQCAIGAKYNAFCNLLVTAQAMFDVTAIEQQVCSAVGLHTAPFAELIAQAEQAIDTKYDNISALHRASKSALTKAITMGNSPTLNRRALTAVDKAMTATMALDGLLYQRVNEAVTAEVILTVDKIMKQEIHPHVQDTVDKIFIFYWNCVIVKGTTAEADLAKSFLKA